MQIFNRWGELLYETNNPDKGWDGTYNGQPCIGGIYVWLIYYESEETSKLIQRQKKGNLLLLR